MNGATAGRGILFVCTGNICRSPLAEGLFHAGVAGRGSDWLIDSAGIHALVGRPPAPLALATAAELGIDIGALRARTFEVTDFAHFQHIVAMDAGHLDYLQAVRPPHWTGRLGLLYDDRGRPFEVPDPYGRAASAYRRAAKLIARGVAALLAELDGDDGAPAGATRRAEDYQPR